MSENICEENQYKAVYNQYVTPLRNFIYYKCGDLKLAEDLGQDAFIKMWENCTNVTKEKAKSYLYTVANNLFLNKVKHQKVVLKFEQKPHSEADIKDPAYLLEEKEFKQKLEKAISDLPEKQREVFLLNRIDKLKYKEIASLLSISVKAVEKRMHNALATLRKVHQKV